MHDVWGCGVRSPYSLQALKTISILSPLGLANITGSTPLIWKGDLSTCSSSSLCLSLSLSKVTFPSVAVHLSVYLSVLVR